MSVVSVTVCKSYDEETVFSAVIAGVAAIGGIEAFVKKNEMIFSVLMIVRNSEKIV